MKNFIPIESLKQYSKKYRNNIALESENKKFSYKKIWNSIKTFASTISKIDETPLVVVVGRKGFLSYVSMLGVLLAGGTYIPISLNLPFKRIFKIILASKSKIIICPDDQKLVLKKRFPTMSILSEKNIFFKRKKNFLKKPKPNRLAYIIFTSGSTGEPKGVCISRESLNHYLKWLIKALKMGPGKRCSQFPEIGFDLSVADIFASLCSGATLIPAVSKYSNIFPGRFIKEKKITHLICVPSLIDIINNAQDLNKKNINSLETIFFCGEPLLKSHVSSIFKAKKRVKIINTYGPTEATVSCTFKRLSFSNFQKFSLTSMSVGKAIPGMKLRLQKGENLNNNEGEILISGIQVADGYLDKNKNKNKFFFNKKQRSFMTGDYAIKKKGEIYFKSRIDNQIKIKGHRIELDEIDYNVRQLGYRNVNSVVLKKYIITFVANIKRINKNEITKKLSKALPEYMVPQYIVKINKLPINRNGKINKNKLIQSAKKIIN
tara:strand:+ start:6166 stop:7638 length:1473 start_codon:yes stop_codon:yes gene_type:complete